MRALILALALTATAAHADTLVIVHPDGQEVMIGDFVNFTEGNIEFNVAEYDSVAWDRIASGGFDEVYAVWRVTLHTAEGDAAFTYDCVDNGEGANIVLNCAE